MNVITVPELANLKVGDTVTRMLGGSIPMELVISRIDDVIECGPWTFNKDTGLEIDEDLGWDGVRITGSFLKSKL